MEINTIGLKMTILEMLLQYNNREENNIGELLNMTNTVYDWITEDLPKTESADISEFPTLN